jgi:hypothetical protein
MNPSSCVIIASADSALKLFQQGLVDVHINRSKSDDYSISDRSGTNGKKRDDILE